METNENGNKTYKNLWDAAKVVSSNWEVYSNDLVH